MSLALFGSSQSVSFECYYTGGIWSTLESPYCCYVQNSLDITSFDAAQVDSISGTHQAGFNDDNVNAFRIHDIGQLHYFPRGLNKFFKNLKGIAINYSGLKEIHQCDLKDFPKMELLYLFGNNLEILEENLFEFNPNLEIISLRYNKISHIDPNVFNKLTKLHSLNFESNKCVTSSATNPSEVKTIIRIANYRCTNSDYSNLEQKVKILEIESKNTNSENLKEKVEKLENEIKNSEFPNFFQEKLQGLTAV